MKVADPALSSPLVFVPSIGFRPPGTRQLRRRAETTVDNTRLMVLAAAAAPGGTDVVIEWARTGDPAHCPPDSHVLVHSNMAPLENGLSAALVTDTSRLNATAMRRRAGHFSHGSIGAIDAMTFPSVPHGDSGAELQISEGSREWRVPLDLAPGPVNAKGLKSEVARQGIVVRATAVSRFEDELIVELEVEGPQQIRQVGAPLPEPVRFSDTSAEDLSTRQAEMRRVFGERSQPIVLEDDRGNRVEEVRRVYSQDPRQTVQGPPFVSGFMVVFDAPSTDAQSATLAVPFVEINDFRLSATADLRLAPLEVGLGEHRFRLVAVEPYGDDQRKIVIEIPPSIASPRFVQPARVQVSGSEFSWERHEAEPPGRDTIWMAAKVGDPPIVTFTGVVLRVDGPMRLEIPLV